MLSCFLAVMETAPEDPPDARYRSLGIIGGPVLQWNCLPQSWRVPHPISLRFYELENFPRLRALAVGKEQLHELPWQTLTEHALISMSSATHTDAVSDEVILAGLAARNLDSVEGMRTYLHEWSASSTLVKDARGMTHWNSQSFAKMAAVGAWFGDCIFSELLVRAGHMSSTRKYRATPNSAYAFLARSIEVCTGDYGSNNNLGNVMEHLMWLALEENRCIFAVAVQHWIVHQYKSNKNTVVLDLESSSSDEELPDISNYTEVAYTTLEHSGDVIELPAGTHIRSAEYETLDADVVLDVTNLTHDGRS